MGLDGPGPRLRRAGLTRTGECKGGRRHTRTGATRQAAVCRYPPPLKAPGQALSALSGPRPRHAGGRGGKGEQCLPLRGKHDKLLLTPCDIRCVSSF